MQIYLDNAATTKIDKRVLKAMLPFLKENYGNASSIHSLGQVSRRAIDESREKIASFLCCSASEIIFTGSATESNNIAIRGTVKKGDRVITSLIEHPAVLNTFRFLEKKGIEVSFLPIKKEGIVKVEDLKKEIRENTSFVSIMYANNEIGTIQPIKEIGDFLSKKDIVFHCDAVQATNYLNCDVRDLKVDLLTLSSHKIYGPKGIGALFVKKGVKLDPIIFGGGQEMDLRPGTENTALIVGFAKAIELIEKDNSKIKELRDYLIERIMKEIPNSFLNGDKERRLCNNVNFSFEGVEGEALVIALDERGIFCSTGSACSTGSLESSHVLSALGNKAHGSLRISLGKENTKTEIDYFIKVLISLVYKLRKVSGYL